MKKLNSLSELSNLNIVYSTNPEYESAEEYDGIQTLPNKQQKLYISLDKKQRGGKKVTLIENFIGDEQDLITLGKALKTKCGVGGSVKDGIILIQGDFRDEIADILSKDGYQIKRKG